MLVKLNEGESVTVMLNHLDEPHAFTLSNFSGTLSAREFHRPKEKDESPESTADTGSKAEAQICPLCLGDGDWENCSTFVTECCPLCKGDGKLLTT